MNTDTSVIIPVYNECVVVDDVIGDISKTFGHIICVDDGSSDGSDKIIENTTATLIKHPINLGAGAATQTGIDYALQHQEVEYIITFDADGQHHTEDAVRMLNYIKNHDVDIVFGSRFLKDSEIKNISVVKKLFLRLAKVFSHFETGVNLTDPHIGLRVFNRRFAEKLNLRMSDFSHASELVRKVREGNYRYAEIPVTITYSDYSKAKGQPMLNSVNIIFDLLLHRITKK